MTCMFPWLYEALVARDDSDQITVPFAFWQVKFSCGRLHSVVGSLSDDLNLRRFSTFAVGVRYSFFKRGDRMMDLLRCPTSWCCVYGCSLSLSLLVRESVVYRTSVCLVVN